MAPLLHEMCPALTRKAALAAYEQFIDSYQIKIPKGLRAPGERRRSSL
jgi:hypothetical protein